jgi:hypothetical protein
MALRWAASASERRRCAVSCACLASCCATDKRDCADIPPKDEVMVIGMVCTRHDTACASSVPIVGAQQLGMARIRFIAVRGIGLILTRSLIRLGRRELLRASAERDTGAVLRPLHGLLRRIALRVPARPGDAMGRSPCEKALGIIADRCGRHDELL